MKDKMRLIVALLIVIILFLITLAIVSMIPEGTPGMLHSREYTVYLTRVETINEVPYFLLDDPDVEVSINGEVKHEEIY